MHVDIDGDRFELYVKHELIERVIYDLAMKMEKELADKKPVFIVVLNGAFMFAADLMRHFEFECEIDFIRMGSYEGLERREKVDTILGLNREIKGRTVVIIEDIVDTGNTLNTLLKEFNEKEPKEIFTATFLYKPMAHGHKDKVDWWALRIPNDFVLGYGLDYKGKGRNLRDIYKFVEQ